MSCREFVDDTGISWYVSEGSDGRDLYLRFDSTDESRCAFLYPPTWEESPTAELAELFKLAIVTWRRGERRGQIEPGTK